MKLKKFAPQKKTAQAMVEFAIVLPVLLLLLYGLLEAGRLLFMYSSIVTASRQAARYGAATGDGTTPGVKRYDDCTGIRQAANKADYLNSFDHTGLDVTIGWDTGGGTLLHPICPTGQASDGWTPPDSSSDPNVNKTRLVVTVTGHYNMIVRLVPFGNRTITATSARTILTGVDIVMPAAGGLETPTISIVDNPTPTSELGQDVLFTVTLGGSSGTPTGTVKFNVNGTPLVGCELRPVDLATGVATCTITFTQPGPMSVTADYSGDSTYNPVSSSPPLIHTVGPTSVNVTIDDNPVWNMPGDPPVHIQVTVWSPHDPTLTKIIPTGSVVITNGEDSCTQPLSNGIASCNLTFNTIGTRTITATYTSDDHTKYADRTDTKTHDVLSSPATATNTAPPATSTSTSTPLPPATSTSTPGPTPVTDCQSMITASGGIQFGSNNNHTMYLNILNLSQQYDVEIAEIYMKWNWSGGAPGRSPLFLQSVQLRPNNFIWNGPKLSQSSLRINITGFDQNGNPVQKFSQMPVLVTRNGTSQLIFTFDAKYQYTGGEEIHIFFKTPGCEPNPIHVTH